MRWPWVSRELYEALVQRAVDAESRYRDARIREHEAVARATAAEIGMETGIGAVEERLQESEAERKLLFDRILQLSGQPPLYTQPQAVAVQVQQEYTGPLPKRRLTHEDIHEQWAKEQQNILLGKPTNGAVI